MTDFGRKQGDMLRSVYDPNKDGVIAVAQTVADMTKAVYDPALAAMQATLLDHNADHESGGDDEIDATGLVGTAGSQLLGDGTLGRVLRASKIYLEDSGTASKIKATLLSKWNGDAIAVTDLIAKGATVGNYSLDADGWLLTIEKSGLSGNVLFAICGVGFNMTTTDFLCSATAVGNDIRLQFTNPTTGAHLDMTAVLDVGSCTIPIIYITDA